MSSDEDSNYSRREKFAAERFSSNDENPPEKDVCEQEMSFGPALPPHLINKNNQNPNNEASDGDSVTYGPQLPQQMRNKNEIYGPQMPEKSEKVIGPEVPLHLLPSNESDEETINAEAEDVQYGPSLSLMTDKDAPLPVNFFEAKQKTTSESVAKRESWMTELPPERAANFGLGPRQFRTKLPTDKECDRSVWTETPNDKGKERVRTKEDDAKLIRQKQIDEKNKEMEALIRKLVKKKKKKKEKESLTEIHKKKLMKKAKKEAKKQEKEGKPAERRPFDRNIDLQVHRFDESQKRAMLRKAALLNNRFASGESKFL